MDARKDGSPRGTKRIKFDLNQIDPSNQIKFDILTKEKAMPAAKKSAPNSVNVKGSKDNPRRIHGWQTIEALFDGYTVFWAVEVCFKPNGKRKERWEEEESVQTSEAAAIKIAKNCRERVIADHNNRLESEWMRANSSNRQTQENVMLRVHKGSNLKALISQVETAHQKMQELPDPVEKPEFNEIPEYPKFRVSKRLIHVTDTVVHEVVDKPKKKAEKKGKK